MDFISLFSGVGGFDLGFERAGMHCIAQVEFNSKRRAILRRHMPGVLQIEDVRNAGKHNLPAAHLVCGGFPCQDVSISGKRAGLAGERSGLFWEFNRILGETSPEWVVIENVPGLLSSNRGRDFGVILNELVKRGYRVAWRVLDSQHFGVPQRRRRVFIVGHLGSGRAAEILFDSEGGSRSSTQSREAEEGIAAPLKSSSPSRRNGGSNPIPGEFVIASTLTTRTGAGTERGDGADNEIIRADPLQKRDAKGWSADAPSNLIVGTLAASGAGRPRPAGQANEADMLITAFNPKGTSDQIVRQGNYAGTLRKTLREAVLNTMGVRRLTPIECERLQGFPDDWTAFDDQGKAMSDAFRYESMGDAVTVPVIEWIGRRILAVAE